MAPWEEEQQEPQEAQQEGQEPEKAQQEPQEDARIVE